MTGRGRLAALTLLLAAGTGLAALLYAGRVRAPLESTLTSPFQILGAPVKLVDRAAGRLVPVGRLDERELGEVLHRRYAFEAGTSPATAAEQRYLDALMREVAKGTHKPFHYRAYVVDSDGPNAIALPGGVVLVTSGLFDTLHSESELVAVLAHETGHIELGHCFDTVKFQLLARKAGVDALGALADFAVALLVRHSFSKAQEDEADTYAWQWLVASNYDPRAEAASFQSLLESGRAHGRRTRQHADPLRDYFESHPPLELRAAKFGERAGQWWRDHDGEARYLGRANLTARRALSADGANPAEWVRR